MFKLHAGLSTGSGNNVQHQTFTGAKHASERNEKLMSLGVGFFMTFHERLKPFCIAVTDNKNPNLIGKFQNTLLKSI